MSSVGEASVVGFLLLVCIFNEFCKDSVHSILRCVPGAMHSAFVFVTPPQTQHPPEIHRNRDIAPTVALSTVACCWCAQDFTPIHMNRAAIAQRRSIGVGVSS